MYGGVHSFFIHHSKNKIKNILNKSTTFGLISILAQLVEEEIKEILKETPFQRRTEKTIYTQEISKKIGYL